MSATPKPKTRPFKTVWFSKAAKKARIEDSALCAYIQQAVQGQADDLGGGVFKKRINNNLHRALILAKAGRFWIFEYLFAKNDRENIDAAELVQFRALAMAYTALNDKQIKQLIGNNHFVEICDDNKD